MGAALRKRPGRKTGRRQYGRPAEVMPIPSIVMG
jgi:hypothetical protein